MNCQTLIAEEIWGDSFGYVMGYLQYGYDGYCLYKMYKFSFNALAFLLYFAQGKYYLFSFKHYYVFSEMIIKEKERKCNERFVN